MPYSRLAPQTNRLAACALFLAVAGAPLLFGSRDLTVVLVWCGVLSAGLFATSPATLNPLHVAVLSGIGLIALAYAFVLHEQLSDNPWFAAFAPVWANTSKLLGEPVRASVSLARGEPIFAIGPALASMLALVLGLAVGSERYYARQLLRVMAIAGAVYGLYGILSELFAPSTILWQEKVAYAGSLTATFINRNTAAVYFGSTAAICLVLLLWRIRSRLPRQLVWRELPSDILEKSDLKTAILGLMFLIALLAMVLTNSRAGVFISLVVITIEFLLFLRRDITGGKTYLLVITVCALIVLVFAQIAGGSIGVRVEAGGLTDAGRAATYQAIFRMIGDYPWFGTGLGTFAWAYPAYRPDTISMAGVWDAAHSTPLEIAAEMGIPIAILVVSAWILAIVVLVRGALRRRQESIVPIAALAVVTIGGAHSLIDFSLQVPGFSIGAFALLGAGVAQSLATPSQADDASPSK